MRFPTYVSTDDEIIQYLKDVAKEAEAARDDGDIWGSHGRLRGHINGLIRTMEGRAAVLKQERQEVRELSERRQHQRRERRAAEPLRDA